MSAPKTVQPFLWQEGVNPKKLELLDRWATGQTALDVGCGHGGYGHYLANRGFAVTAIDKEDRLEDKDAIRFLSAQVPPIPVESNSCDTLILFDVLEHVATEDELLAEARRVTRQRLILSVPSDEDGALPSYGLCLVHHMDKTHRREYNPSSLRAKLDEYDFELRTVEAHYPERLPFVIEQFFRNSFAGRICRSLTHRWLRALKRLKLVEVDLVADWFAVADLRSPEKPPSDRD